MKDKERKWKERADEMRQVTFWIAARTYLYHKNGGTDGKEESLSYSS